MIAPTVFIVDDDEAVRDSIEELVRSVGLPAQSYVSAVDYLAAYDPGRAGCLVLDIRMARMSGIALQAKLNEIGSRTPIIFITGHADVPTAVAALRAGTPACRQPRPTLPAIRPASATRPGQPRPQFLLPDQPIFGQMVALATVHALLVGLWLSAWTAVIGTAARALAGGACKRLLNRITGAVLFGLGARSALA